MARTRASRRTKAEALGRVSSGRLQKSTASTSIQTRSSTRRASRGDNGSDSGKDNNNPPNKYVHSGRNPKDQRCTRCIQYRKACSGGRPCDLCRRANVSHLCIRADANFRRDSGAARAISAALTSATSVSNLPGPASSPGALASGQVSPARGTETASPSPAPALAPTTPVSQSVNGGLFTQQSSSPEIVTPTSAQALLPVAPPSPVQNVPGSTIFAPLGTGPDPYWVPIPSPTPSPPATTSRS